MFHLATAAGSERVTSTGREDERNPPTNQPDLGCETQLELTHGSLMEVEVLMSQFDESVSTRSGLMYILNYLFVEASGVDLFFNLLQGRSAQIK